MNRHTLAAIAVIILPVALAVGFVLFSAESVLTVFLKCDGEMSGSLSVATILENGELGYKKRYDLKTACQAGKIEFSDYQGQESLKFVFERGDGKTFEVIGEYGRDIQHERDIRTDQWEFYMILKIMNAPPFIANDSL